MARGILAYATSPLWLGFLILGGLVWANQRQAPGARRGSAWRGAWRGAQRQAPGGERGGDRRCRTLAASASAERWAPGARRWAPSAWLPAPGAGRLAPGAPPLGV